MLKDKITGFHKLARIKQIDRALFCQNLDEFTREMILLNSKVKEKKYFKALNSDLRVNRQDTKMSFNNF